MFKNTITTHLENCNLYANTRDLAAYLYPSPFGDVCVMYFATRFGAITPEGMREMASVLHKGVDDRKLVGFILTENNATRPGKPHVSFPGLDIQVFGEIFAQTQQGHREPMQELLELGQRLVQQIAELPKRMVSTFLGDCYGGGVELTCFTHSVVSPSAGIALPECTLDPFDFFEPEAYGIDKTKVKESRCLFPGWHGLRSVLARMMERGRTLDEARAVNEELVFDGMAGKRAARIAVEQGIVDEIHSDDALFDAAIARFDFDLHPFAQRTLGEWRAPSRSPEVVSRISLGQKACDLALYGEDGSWTQVGRRDAELMIDSMLRGLGASDH